MRQIESIRWDVSEQSLADYERSLEQCTFLWNDAVFSDAFSPTWQAYMYEGKPGDEVARDFFAAHRIALPGSAGFQAAFAGGGWILQAAKNGLVRTITEKAALCEFPVSVCPPIRRIHKRGITMCANKDQRLPVFGVLVAGMA